MARKAGSMRVGRRLLPTVRPSPHAWLSCAALLPKLHLGNCSNVQAVWGAACSDCNERTHAWQFLSLVVCNRLKRHRPPTVVTFGSISAAANAAEAFAPPTSTVLFALGDTISMRPGAAAAGPPSHSARLPRSACTCCPGQGLALDGAPANIITATKAPTALHIRSTHLAHTHSP